MKICVIGSCGKKKLAEHPNSPTCIDIHSKTDLQVYQERFASLCHPAREMYTGNQNQQLVRGVDLLRKIEDAHIDFYIISAGFGFLHEAESVPPYECTFAGMKKELLLGRSRALKIEKDFAENCVNRYDFLYLALGKDYFTALGDDWLSQESGVVFQFVDQNPKSNVLWFPSGNDTVQAFSSNGFKVHGASGFKGDLLRILANYVLSEPDPYSELIGWTEPSYLKQLFSDFTSSAQLRF
ncbi:MAG: hypothetical protein ACFFEF_11025 [Candidatus Thorarchaeota archaeon]